MKKRILLLFVPILIASTMSWGQVTFQLSKVMFHPPNASNGVVESRAWILILKETSSTGFTQFGSNSETVAWQKTASGTVHKAPVAYASGYIPRISASFNINNPSPSEDCAPNAIDYWVRGKWNSIVFAKSQKLDKGNYNVVAANYTFPAGVVDYDENFTIEWQWSTKENAPDNDWQPAGTSSHRMYVTHGIPARRGGESYQNVPTPRSFHHAEVHIACTKADGLSDPLAITDAIFNDFSSDLCVTGESNTACLRYWGGWSSNNAFEQAACRSINAFLYDQDARCGEWVEFFQDILRLHGIRNEANPGNGLYGSNPVIMVAYTKKSSGPGYSNHGVLPAYKRQRLYDKLSNYFGSAFNPGSPFNQSNSVYLPEGYGSGSDINVVGEFYIREMNFNDIYQNDNGENKLYLAADANAAPLIIQGNPVPYNQIKGCDSAGVPGQGNGNPKSFFWNHVFVNYVGKYFDPSYGVTKDSKSQYVNDNVEGFGCQVVYKNPNLIQIPLLWLDDKISTADHSDFFGD